jgi:hypothetical protein
MLEDYPHNTNDNTLIFDDVLELFDHLTVAYSQVAVTVIETNDCGETPPHIL